MGTFFLLVLFFIILIVAFVLSIAGNIIRAIFGIRKGNRYNSKQNTKTKIYEPPSKKSKIIDKSEGEYVDFEEMK